MILTFLIKQLFVGFIIYSDGDTVLCKAVQGNYSFRFCVVHINFLLHRDDPKAELVYIILQELLLCVAVVRCFPSER